MPQFSTKTVPKFSVLGSPEEITVHAAELKRCGSHFYRHLDAVRTLRTVINSCGSSWRAALLNQDLI